MKQQLIQAQHGDEQALAGVVDIIRPRLTRMAAWYASRSSQDAEDLLQEAWIGLLEAVNHVKLDIGSPEAYLVQCARWRILDTLRRERIRQCESLNLLEECGPDDVDLDVLSTAFVAQLPPRPRAVLVCILAGMTWREAGVALGCSSANIAYHMRQIRVQWRAWEG